MTRPSRLAQMPKLWRLQRRAKSLDCKSRLDQEVTMWQTQTELQNPSRCQFLSNQFLNNALEMFQSLTLLIPERTNPKQSSAMMQSRLESERGGQKASQSTTLVLVLTMRKEQVKRRNLKAQHLRSAERIAARNHLRCKTSRTSVQATMTTASNSAKT